MKSTVAKTRVVFRNLATPPDHFVVYVDHDDRRFRFRHDVQVSESREGTVLLLECPEMDIIAYGESKKEAWDNFGENVKVCWDSYAQAPDVELSSDAVDLKRRILELVDVERLP